MPQWLVVTTVCESVSRWAARLGLMLVQQSVMRLVDLRAQWTVSWTVDWWARASVASRVLPWAALWAHLWVSQWGRLWVKLKERELAFQLDLQWAPCLAQPSATSWVRVSDQRWGSLLEAVLATLMGAVLVGL